MNCDDFGGSIHGFSFTSFDVLRNRAIPLDSPVGKCIFQCFLNLQFFLIIFFLVYLSHFLICLFIDIIGYVDGWFPMIDYTNRNGKTNKKMSLQLRDLELHILIIF